MAFRCNCFSRGISLTGEKLRGTFLIDIVLQPTTKVFFFRFSCRVLRLQSVCKHLQLHYFSFAIFFDDGLPSLQSHANAEIVN